MTPNCWLSGSHISKVEVFIFEVMGLEPLKMKATPSFNMTQIQQHSFTCQKSWSINKTWDILQFCKQFPTPNKMTT